MVSEYNFDLDNRIIFGFDNEFDKAELYNYYTASAYAESDEAIFSQYFDLQLRPKENTYTTFGLRRDYHTTAEDYYTGRATIAYKPDNNTKLRSNIGTSVRFPALNSYHHGHYLLNKERLKAETGKSIDVFSPNHTRSFCYVEDAVNQIFEIMSNSSCENQTINLGNQTREIKIYDLAKICMQTVGKDIQLNKIGETEGSAERRTPSMKKSMELTGYHPKISLEDGIAMTYSWYLDNVFKA